MTEAWDRMRFAQFVRARGHWTNSFIFEAGYYSGRGQNAGDLNERTLKQIQAGLAKDFSEVVARDLFPVFLNKLPDLSASAFITQMDRWAATGWDPDFEPTTDTEGPRGIGQTLGALMSRPANDSRAAILGSFYGEAVTR